MVEERRTTFLGATISRRSLLAGSAIFGGAAIAACGAVSERDIPDEQNILAPQREPTPPGEAAADEYVYFSEGEARTVEAIVARIIPGDANDPGAIEAGVPIYIDRKLQTFETYAEPTYQDGPFPEGYEEDEQPPDDPDVVGVPEDELYRYGFQSELTHRQLYQLGLAGVDRLAQTRYGALFVDLDEDDQDELLMVLDGVQQRSEDGGNSDEGGTGATDANGGGGNDGNGGNGGNGNDDGPTDDEMDQAEDLFDEADPGAFFDTIRIDTIEGMFSDPAYGGNRNLVGWSLIGWPGAQRSYSPYEMLHGTDKPPTSMDGLTPMNPDRVGPGRDALEQPQPGVHHH